MNFWSCSQIMYQNCAAHVCTRRWLYTGKANYNSEIAFHNFTICSFQISWPPDMLRKKQWKWLSNYGNYSSRCHSLVGKKDENECILVFCISGAAPLIPDWIFMLSWIWQIRITGEIFHYTQHELVTFIVNVSGCLMFVPLLPQASQAYHLHNY